MKYCKQWVRLSDHDELQINGYGLEKSYREKLRIDPGDGDTSPAVQSIYR